MPKKQRRPDGGGAKGLAGADVAKTTAISLDFGNVS